MITQPPGRKIMTTIPSEEQRRRQAQRSATLVLGDLLEQGLPLVMWNIHPLLGRGEINGLLWDELPDNFTAWMTYLGDTAPEAKASGKRFLCTARGMVDGVLVLVRCHLDHKPVPVPVRAAQAAESDGPELDLPVVPASEYAMLQPGAEIVYAEMLKAVEQSGASS
jgi:hypothetical protein